MMSSTAETTEASTCCCCANCGAAEVDNIKLEECDGCGLVKYCSDKCKKEHREEHEEECKKWRALLHDKTLFTQPDETHLGECPLCFLPLPIDIEKTTFYSCCCKSICNGCSYADDEGDRCPFCREPAVGGDEENEKRIMERAKANDPDAITYMGGLRYRVGDYVAAFEYWTKATKLGDYHAHGQLGMMYENGDSVEVDEEKAVYHFEKAAIGGHPYARYSLGWIEEKNGRIERAVKHFIIAAKLGDELSMEALRSQYSKGNITKEDLDATLRSHQAAIDEAKSAQRDAARKAQLHDRELFTQPNETDLGECPLCFLPLPIELEKSTFYSCCSNTICNGCSYADQISNGGGRCPFCREPVPDNDEESDKRLMKRVKANDPVALKHMGMKCRDEGDYGGAFEYYTKASELGNAEARYELGCMYDHNNENGEGIEKDEEKAVYHYEKAAIAGHPYARNSLGWIEEGNGNIERAVKHFIIGANLGYERSMKKLWDMFKDGDITKEDLEATLRTHKAALDEMKSAQRDAAEVAFSRFRGN